MKFITFKDFQNRTGINRHTLYLWRRQGIDGIDFVKKNVWMVDYAAWLEQPIYPTTWKGNIGG